MVPDQCLGLMSVKKIKIDSLSLNGLHTNTEATVSRTSLDITVNVLLY